MRDMFGEVREITSNSAHSACPHTSFVFGGVYALKTVSIILSENQQKGRRRKLWHCLRICSGTRMPSSTRFMCALFMTLPVMALGTFGDWRRNLIIFRTWV